MFPVREIHLEDVLLSTGYTTPEMERLRRRCPNHRHPASASSSQARSDVLADITRGLSSVEVGGNSPDQEDADVVLEEGFDAPVPVPPLGLEARERMDQALSQAFINGKQEHFAELTRLIFEENYPMDYKVNPFNSITFRAILYAFLYSHFLCQSDRCRCLQKK